MKRTIFFIICCLFTSLLSFGQTSTETFETESHGSSSFIDNGVIFNLISHIGIFDVQANYPSTGWNGTSIDNKYIDNSNDTASPPSFSIKTTSNLFKVNRFWMYLSKLNLDLNAAGTLTVAGKLSGVTKFIQTKTTGFATSMVPSNGYTLIDLTNLNGQNYSNIIIDELQITLGGEFRYAGFDAFTWVKDSGIVLSTAETKTAKQKMTIYPNPTNGPLTIYAGKATDAQVYSADGKLVKTLPISKGANDINISELPKGTYFIKTSTESTKIIKN
ncbi:T9SS type A sorting domain-containing protein [Chryseobacterium sp. WG14]|uniref:T9SS type A sorting domain-containing protein n=1 Tax=unclassified Chryseobacterium TaxID=2593645 RepID=UPI00211DD312|nr:MULTISPECIES: T9SS type A sorting domain-containing protein [unclassified Chryseobacterium]MCQ9637467.1 T9SS type A sorting domain-containing protein [Chryseobacterium sp. WG23]MCQ9641884.1 T9SS type A sorting domain-containing protein [Chryseobacterium sp. WG14]